MDELELGIKELYLTVRLRAGEPFPCALARYGLNADGSTGDPLDWDTSAPVQLVFSDGTAWTADLAGNLATFSIDGTATTAVATLADPAVRLTVGGLTWAAGEVILR